MTRGEVGALLFAHGWHLRNALPACDYWHRGDEWIEIYTFGVHDAHYGVKGRCLDMGSRAGIVARHMERKDDGER